MIDTQSFDVAMQYFHKNYPDIIYLLLNIILRLKGYISSMDVTYCFK